MKEGYLLKQMSKESEITPEELKQIHQYTRRAFSPEELYVFSVVLCDNQVDRDYECFTQQALEKLKGLFLGKTGIFDHSPTCGGQTARIFHCEVETLPDRKNQLDEPYARLVARAYLPRTSKNEDFITELDSGIKKEVSVGCAVNRVTCSICGQDLRQGSCSHQKGKIYGGKLCCAVLEDPYDAYEWSFVAVPAQREAGVIKMFEPENREAQETKGLLERLSEGKEIFLSAQECQRFARELLHLTEKAKSGEAYEQELRQEVVRLSMAAQPEIPKGVMEQVAKRLTVEELKVFQKAYRRETDKLLPPKPQLAAVKPAAALSENEEFKI